ncbi:MAG: dTMP kinase [Candidatus Heimdallarchaeota archaeon]|nr:dTMP kinase [Candidatus Heimdallarchaeota archaeon]
MSSGLFISLEGIDGSGKSTQLNLLKEELNKRGYEVVTTSEPTTTKLGKILRDYLSNPESVPYADALVFAADRVEHYHEFIKPRLDSGKIVITDRYTASSIVYQGSQGVPKDWIQEINKMSLKPDLSFYIDISVEVALERLADSQRDTLEKFENRDYLVKIMKNYEDIDYLIPIPGEGDPITVTHAIVEKIIEELSK